MNLKTKESTKLVDELTQKQYLRRHLDTLRSHHNETLEHSLRVGMLAADIGFENNLDRKDVEQLAIAGLLHDLGKCDISHDILDKNGPLNNKEREEINKHAKYGNDRIKQNFLGRVKKMVFGHHGHNVTGSYARRKKGSVPYLTDIVAVADVFDALSNERPYKRPFNKRRVKKILCREFPGNEMLVNQVLERY